MSFGLNGIDNSQALNSIYQNNASNLSNAGSAGAGDMQQRVQSNNSPFENQGQQQQGGAGSKGQSSGGILEKLLDLARDFLSKLSSLIPIGGLNSGGSGGS